MTTPYTAVHWHAYAYTGATGYVPDFEKETPIDAAAWLARPARQIMATLEGPEDAEAWMRQQLAVNPPADGEHGHLSATLYLRQRLHADPPGTPWASYWDRHGRYLVRLLVSCPRRQHPCPLGKPSL